MRVEAARQCCRSSVTLLIELSATTWIQRLHIYCAAEATAGAPSSGSLLHPRQAEALWGRTEAGDRRLQWHLLQISIWITIPLIYSLSPPPYLVPSSAYPGLMPCAISLDLFLHFHLSLSFSLSSFLPRSLARSLFLSLSLLHHFPPLSWCAPCIGVVPTFGKEGLRSSCRLVGNAVPGAARTLRMVTKGAPTALSLREFPDELLCYLHASEAMLGASMALTERMEQYRSVTTRLQR